MCHSVNHNYSDVHSDNEQIRTIGGMHELHFSYKS